MPTALSTDLRIRIVEARAQDRQTYEQLAERFGVGRASVSRVLRLARETGSVEPTPHAGGTPKRVTATEHAVLHELIRARPDATLAELCADLATRTGVRISRSTMSRELRRLQLTLKKSPWWPKNAVRRRSRPCARRSSSGCSVATQSG